MYPEKIRKIERMIVGNDTETLRDDFFDPDDILMHIIFYELGLGATIDYISYEIIIFTTWIGERRKFETTISSSMFAMNNYRILISHWMEIQKLYSDSQIYDFLAEPDSPVRSELRELFINETKAKLALLSFADFRPEFKNMARLPREEFIMLWNDLNSGNEEIIKTVGELVE